MIVVAQGSLWLLKYIFFSREGVYLLLQCLWLDGWSELKHMFGLVLAVRLSDTRVFFDYSIDCSFFKSFSWFCLLMVFVFLGWPSVIWVEDYAGVALAVRLWSTRVFFLFFLKEHFIVVSLPIVFMDFSIDCSFFFNRFCAFNCWYLYF